MGGSTQFAISSHINSLPTNDTYMRHEHMNLYGGFNPLYPVLRMRITSVNYQNNLITARGR